MRVTAQGRAMLAKKYAGREFIVYDLKDKIEMGDWSINLAAVYSARDVANEMTKSQRFVVRHRACIA